MLTRKLLFVVILALSISPLGFGARADTFVFPHLLENSGSVAGDAGAFDTVIRLSLPGDVVCNPDGDFVVVWLYALDADGNPLIGGGGIELANPLVIDMLPGTNQSISIQDLYMAAGGFPVEPVDGFLLLQSGVGGGGAGGHLVVRGDVGYTATGPGDLSVFVFEPQPIAAAAAAPPLPDPSCRTFVFPHLLETSGSILDPGQWDNTIYAVYSADLPGVAADGSGATVNLYLFDEATGAPLVGLGGEDVCFPCSYPMATIEPRKRKINVGTILAAAEAFPAGQNFLEIAAVMTVEGDAGAVNLMSASAFSKTGPGDLSVFVFSPQEIDGAAGTPAPDLPADFLQALNNYPNPFNPKTRISFTLPADGKVALKIYDANGRQVRTLIEGFRAAGEQNINWDGKDDAGNALSSGIYFSRLETAQGLRVGKLTLVR